MAAGNRMAGDVFGMVTPDAEDIITAALRAALAPQHEEWHHEPPAAVEAVMDEVDRGAGAVFVAARADRFGVSEATQVLGEDFGFEHRGIAEHRAQKEFRLGADQPFG